MTATTDTSSTHYAEPPPQVPDPRPMVDTLRSWPFVVMGVSAIAVLGAVTIGPSLWSDPEPARQPEPEARMTSPRPLNNMPLDYSQVRIAPPPKPEEPKAEAQTPQTTPAADPQVQVIQGGGGQRNGPSKAELLRAARMSDIKRVPVTTAGYVGDQDGGIGGGGAAAGGNGAVGGSRLYGKHALVAPYPCQVDAATNIRAMTEQVITSESPGTVSAVTMSDVWSSNKQCLAIPRGTRFVGRYQTQVAEGQARLGIVWTGLTRPSPRKDTIDLDQTVAGDPDGTAGVSGEVDTHFWHKLGYVAAATLLDLGKTAITAGGEGGVGAAVAGIFANRAASPIDEWASRQLDIPPTIRVEPREISITLAQHLPMSEFRSRR